MKLIPAFPFLFLLAILFLTEGCRKSDSVKHSGGQAEVPQNANANDPRWRNELFMSNVASIRGRAVYENPEQYLNSLNQVVDRFNGWIQSRQKFEGWKTDPMLSKQILFLNSLDPLGEKIAELSILFRNSEVNVPLSESQAEVLHDVAENLKIAVAEIPENASMALKMLRERFQKFREFILFQMIQNQISEEMKLRFQSESEFWDQLGILTGTDRLLFKGTRKSNIPLTPGEVFTISYENDVYVLFEQFLLHDVSLWAQGTPQTEHEEVRLESRNESDSTGARNLVRVSAEDLERMKSIFQWTSVNIALVPERENYVPRLPLEVLLSGQGTIRERAWVSILLARQQDLNAFLIEVPTNTFSRLLVGFLFNGEIFLFDPELGISVLNPKVGALSHPWTAVWDGGHLRGTPARWKDVCANPLILEAFWKMAGLNIEGLSEKLAQAKVLLEASPWYLSQRMAILQENLKNGKNRVVMSLSPVEVLEDGTISEESLDNAFNAPSALKKKILAENEFKSVDIWDWPIQATILRAFHPENRLFIFREFCTPFPDGNFNLWRGRMLYLDGILTGPLSAAGYFQRARLSEAELEVNYQQGGPALLDFYRACRCRASYELGLISLMLERPEAAEDSFCRHVLATNFRGFDIPAKLHCAKMCELREDWVGAKKYYSELLNSPEAKIRMGLLPQ